MFAVSDILEGLVRLALLMIPVLGVLLLIVAAHLVGGASKVRHHDANEPGKQ